MRRNDERALYGLADDDDRPDPTAARNAAEFVALLGALVEHSGLSLSEIEELAGSKGYVLPAQFIATALSNDSLPPEELVVALVRSIGINDREVKYWVEVLWRLESRTTYNPGSANQEPERKAPRDIDEIYGTKEQAALSVPYVVPAPIDLDVDDDDEDDEEDESYEEPDFNGAERAAAVDEVHVANPPPGKPLFSVTSGYETVTGYEPVEYDEPHVEAPVSPAVSHGYPEVPPAHAPAWPVAHHAFHDDGLRYDGGHPEDAHILPRYDTPAQPTRRGRRVTRKAKWPLPVAVGLSVMLAVSVVALSAFGGDGETPRDSARGPQGTPGQTGISSTTLGEPPSATAQPTGEVVAGSGGNFPVDPNNPNPNPQQTTQGPPPAQTQPPNHTTQLSGSGSTSCTNEGGQWRVRIMVSVTVTDPPSGLVPQGQAGLSGSMQGFSLSGGGSTYSGSTTVSVGPSSSPSVGTVQWVVTMSVPGGRVARDESFEGYSCA